MTEGYRVALMSFTCGNCEKVFSLRPVPYEDVCCTFCGALALRTPLSDELDYEPIPQESEHPMMTPVTPNLREAFTAYLAENIALTPAAAQEHAARLLSLLRPPAAPLDAPSGQRNVYAVAGITGEGFHLGSIDPHHTQYVDAPRHITQAVVEALGAALPSAPPHPESDGRAG
jgi:hypothetical protein